MDLLLALVTAAGSIALGLGLCRARWAGPAALVALGAGVVALLAGVLQPGERTLVVTHTFAAYAPDGFDVVPRHFPVDEVRAPGWQWPLPFLGWTGVWAVVLLLRRQATGPVHPLLPLLLGWTGTAAWLLMQKCAAPALVVQPFGLERFLLPASIALAVAVSLRGERLLAVLFVLSFATIGMRAPAATFSKLASDGHWGTGLDVHTITAFVDPLQRVEVEAAPGSLLQQGWLIWGQQLFFLPGIYLLSLTGIAFGLFLWRKHGGPAAGAGA